MHTTHTCTQYRPTHNTHVYMPAHTTHTTHTCTQHMSRHTRAHTKVCLHAHACTRTHSWFLAGSADRLWSWSAGSWRLRAVRWPLGACASRVTGPRARRPASRPLPGEAAAARGGGGDDLLGAQGAPAHLPHAAAPGDEARPSAAAVAERCAGCRAGWGGARWPMPRGRHVPPVS